jgi:hypothetical protein
MWRFRELKKLFLSGLKSNQYKALSIKTHPNSTDSRIDDVLGNSFQYKLNDEWHYDTNITLPNGDLEIIGVKESNKVCKIIYIKSIR